MRLQITWLSLVIALTTVRVAAGQSSQSILDQIKPDSRATLQKTKDGIRITSRSSDSPGRCQTDAKFDVPLTITARVKTLNKDVRLYYGNAGIVVLNRTFQTGTFAFVDPVTSAKDVFKDRGKLPLDKWVNVQWMIEADRTRVVVDGVEITSFQRNYTNLSGQVGIGGFDGGTIIVDSLTVESAGSHPAPGKPKERISIDVPVPTNAPGGDAPADAVTDPNAIERPEFARKQKPLVKSVTAVTAMVTRTRDDGDQLGMTADIIATVKPDSRAGDKASAGFYRADGDEMMKVSFQEAMRAVTLRYPYWEPGRIDVGFGEKFTSHGGPSAGTAFALLILSTLEGIDLDPKVAVTGDITVDWRVRKVGGVTAKLRGATLDKCDYALIPEDNAVAFTDMGVLYGPSAIYGIQVFSIATLQDAVAVARKDRSPQVTEAIKLFADVQARMAKDEKSALKDVVTKALLEKVLELAPNHLSAKNLLAICDGTAPKVLSNTATIYQLSVIFYPYAEILVDGKKLNRDTLAPHVTALARKRIAALRPIASKELQPLIADTAAMIEAMDSFATGRGSYENLKTRWQNMVGRYATVFSDKGMMEKLIREGY